MGNDHQPVGEKRPAGFSFDLTGLLDEVHPLFVGANENIRLRGGEDLLGQNVGSGEVEYKIRCRLDLVDFADLT